MGNIITPAGTTQFVATLSSPVSALTGDGTTATLIWDTLASGAGYSVSTGIFTAPVAATYLFLISVYCSGITTSHTASILQAIAASGNFQLLTFNLETAKTPGNVAMFPPGVLPLKMASGDTVYFNLQVSNGTKVVAFNTLSTLSAARLIT